MMVKNNHSLKYSALILRDEDGGATGSLLVDTGTLATYGDYLIGTEETLNTLLDGLDKAMKGLSSSWNDAASAELISGFSTFITSAKGIGTDLKALGTFAKSQATKYDDILKNSLAIMNSGGS